MSRFYYYDLATGVFTGQCVSSSRADQAFLDANAREGLGLIDGVADHLSQRVDVGTGKLLDYIPSSPGEDYQWSNVSRRWELSDAAVIREQRRRQALSEIERLEREVQPRIIRELRLAELESRRDSGAENRLAQLDARIAELRVDLGPDTRAGNGIDVRIERPPPPVDR